MTTELRNALNYLDGARFENYSGQIINRIYESVGRELDY